MLLATDLDGTFLAGTSPDKQQLYRLIRDNKYIRLVFVTGRGLASVMPLLNDPAIPRPEFIISDVGATIVDGRTLEPVEPIQTAIEKKWPGSLKVLDHLKSVKGIEYQEVPQNRRCSFYANEQIITEQIKEKVNEIGCDLVYSANKYLDILPKSVNKGTSLINLVIHLGVDCNDVLVAGDTLNDLAMYECGFKGVVVGGAEEKLVEATKSYSNIYYPELPGAGGILLAMAHFGFTKPVLNTARLHADMSE